MNIAHVFISHNKKQKARARMLAMALVENGSSVWFDEWNLRPGDSLTGGIEEGLTKADVFVLLWSKEAAQSKWVGTEVRAYLRRRVDDNSLRIVPVMLDETPLPTLVADYKGYQARTSRSLGKIAADISGNTSEAKLVQRLKKRLDELTIDGMPRTIPLPTRGARSVEAPNWSEAVPWILSGMARITLSLARIVGGETGVNEVPSSI